MQEKKNTGTPIFFSPTVFLFKLISVKNSLEKKRRCPAVTRRHRLLSEDFARRLRKTRETRGLTQAALAIAAGWVTGQAISEIERARVGVTVADCARLAGALGVSPCWLAYGAEGAGTDAAGCGVRLREAREAAGYSQRRLTVVLGYGSNSQLSLLESGDRGLEIGQAERLAAALGVEPGWLAYGP